MKTLVIKEDYDIAPVLAIIDPEPLECKAASPYTVIKVDDETAARIEAAIKAYWSVQYELGLHCELVDKEDDKEAIRDKLRKHRHEEGIDNV